MKPASTALPIALCPVGERGVISATVTLALSMCDCIGNRVSDMSLSLQPRGVWTVLQPIRHLSDRAGLLREASLTHVRAVTHASPWTWCLLGAEQLAQCSHISFQLLDTEYILVLDCVKVLTGSTVPLATLTGAVSVASHLGRPAVDTGIDSTTFARSW